MDINLKGKLPKARTLEEANELIKALWDIIHRLNESKKTNSKNSSLPPSKDRSSKHKSNIKRNEQRKKNPKNPGGQPGHKKHERSLLPVEEVDHIVSCAPDKQCVCGGYVIVDANIHRRQQQYEFPVIKPIVTEYQICTGVCKGCNKRHIGKLPSGVSSSMLGPRATAMTAHLSGTYRISKQNIVHMYQDIFGFQLSTGMVCKAEKTVSRAISAPVEAAKQYIQSAENVGVHADETGFKEKGKSMWAWVGITCRVAAFIIRKGRTKKVAQELLGTGFSGILCSDRYSAYQWVPANRRQLCWAHLERDFRKISERTGISRTIGLALLHETQQLFHHWHQFKTALITRDTLKMRTKRIRMFVDNLLRRGKRSKNKKTSGTCHNILTTVPALWRFLEIENIEPTNNLAEQMIRTLAIWRKTSFGTQSTRGSLYMERIMTVVATCKLQSRNILEYLTRAVRSFTEGSDPPSLLPETIKSNPELLLAA